MDVFGRVCIHPNTFGRVRMLVAFVPNTGEASDEVCASTASKSPKYVPSKQKTTTGFASNKCVAEFNNLLDLHRLLDPARHCTSYGSDLLDPATHMRFAF